MCTAAAGSQTSPTGGAVSGAVTGASTGAMLGPWGAGIGAVGGGLMGMIAANNARQVAKGNQNAMKNAQDDLILENRRRATTDYLRDVRLEQLQSEQENQSVQEKAADITRQDIQAKGTAVASSAERGISGGRSLDTVLADFDFQQNNEIGRMRQNQLMQDQQHIENAGADYNQYSARYNDVKPYVPRTQPPVDYFTPIFGLAENLTKSLTGLPRVIGGTGTPAPPDITSKDYGSLIK